ncbi:hypothetical protein F5Y10DRAFT_266531 [Nemania abortiva]|nr:hypothetical protein F5Y10DRAFT_266531 [Nemania abortiva]
MPRSDGTRRISNEEWEGRKARIVELYITLRRTLNGPKGVIEMMRNEGFAASVPQYEHQFRKWGVRKNKVQSGRTRIARGVNQGGDVIHGNDRTISGGRPQRARDLLLSRTHQEEESVSRHFDRVTQTENINIPRLGFEGGFSITEADVEQIASNQEMELFITDGWDTSDDKSMANLFNGSRALQDPNDIQWNIFDSLPTGFSFDLSPVGQFPTRDPSRARSTPSEPSTVVPSSRDDWLRHPLPSSPLVAAFIQSAYIRSPTTPASSALTETRDSEFLFKFSNVITETSRWLRPNPVPDSLTSPETFVGEEWSQLSKLSDDISFEARFDGRLIASVINAFAGLPEIPAAGILKFLSRHPAMQQVVLNLSTAQSGPLTKSFVEKAFLAYIEADNVEAVKLLLSFRLVDVDNAVCHYNGERYTPLEYAAIKDSFKVLQLLINRKVDVNKSFPRAYHFNSLYLLIEGRHKYGIKVALDGGFLQSVNALLEAKATISTGTIERALWFTDTQLAIRFLKDLASHSPHMIISHKGLLRIIVMNLDKQNATETFHLIMNQCLKLGKAQYPHQFPLHIAEALEEAMRRGYDELTELLFPYTPSLGEALRTATKVGNQAIVKLILQKYHGLVNISDIFTFALTSGDEDSLRSLESDGVFNHLQGSKLGQALTAALRAGNLEYATKLLELDPDLTYCAKRRCNLHESGIFDIACALKDALAHDFDKISWKLLAVGLKNQASHEKISSSPPSHQRSSPSLLRVAVERGRLDFVEAIIHSGFGVFPSHVCTSDTNSLLETAIEYTDNTIFDIVWKACPRPTSPSVRFYKLALEKERGDLFFEIFKSASGDFNFLGNPALEAAVECENESVLDKLISLGAPADDNNVLYKAANEHPSMVRPLVDRFWKAYPQGQAGYGDSLVQKSLSDYSRSPKSLDIVFEMNLVAMNVRDQAYSEKETLLITAIRTEDYHVVQRFIGAGSNVNTVSRRSSLRHGSPGITALLHAIEKGIIEIVQLLIDHGANINEPAQFGLRWTPLQKAAEVNSLSIVRLLLKSGANVNAAPPKFTGATALQFAAIHGNCEMATILIEHGARQDIPPSIGLHGRYPLEGAAEHGRFDMIELLWNAPRGPFDDEQCQKAMRLAKRNGHVGCKEKIEELMTRHGTVALTPMLLNQHVIEAQPLSLL